MISLRIFRVKALFSVFAVSLFAVDSEESELLREIGRTSFKNMYELSCLRPSDINEHVIHLRRLAKECSSVVELGVGGMVSTWGILQGLSESSHENRSYLGVDLNRPPENLLQLAQYFCKPQGIAYDFMHKNDLEVDIDPVDFLFIDSLHTYAHLTYELETFSPKVRKYIAMHDTSDPYALADCQSYRGNHSEYPLFVNREKRGTWVAVWDFLAKHPEWQLQERHFNNNGFTILKRVGEK